MALRLLAALEQRQQKPVAKTYRKVELDGRQFAVHRVVMSVVLGRALEPWEDVHHVDGDIFNNDPSNLEVLRDGEHMVRHNARRPLVAFCAVCGNPFLLGGAGRKTRRHCSRRCGARGRWLRRRIRSRPGAAAVGRP